MFGDSTSTILLPVFGGQGVLSYDTEGTAKRLALYTSFPFGGVLYEACYDAFQRELRSLPSDLVERVRICATDFKEKASILNPIHEQYISNPVISGTTLLLHQMLQYLYFIEKFDSETNGCPLEKKFQENTRKKVGILGFSSGILAAAVVAASRTKLDVIKHAVEAYRLAFWIGVRVQLFCANTQSYQNSNPWALVIFSNESDVEKFVLVFNKMSEARVFITAVIDDNCVTVSGHPDDLATFRAFLPNTTVVFETNIAGLYHVPSRLYTARDEVLGDVASRHIRFPTFPDLFTSLRCSYTGEILHSSMESLVSTVIDMILMHPVHWDEVVKNASASIPLDSPVQILNFGGSKGLVKSLTKYLKQHGISNVQCLEMGGELIPQESQSHHEPIAIVGMAVKMPGTDSVDELWNILKNGLKTLEFIPSDRFQVSDYTTGRTSGRSMNVDTGNFIKDVGWFDNKFFGINPREAMSMDPQQRILLHMAYEALEDAGYIPDSTPTFSRETFGCYIGAATHDYSHNLRQEIDLYYATGTLGAFLSGRLSYYLGLSGPSMVIDTACSSSTVAIHQACRALLNGDCNAALAGGVNVISSPDMFIGLDRAHFLSPTGCKSFDASADGYSRSEGCGLFVLKRLSDAVAENDRILGVVRGVEVNQNGMAQSITRPHGSTQELLLKRVLVRSDVDPQLINFVESHGTGTQVGDVDELQSLRRILAVNRASSNPLYIGSIKANIGHLEAASGSASLAKVLLMLRHKVIPAQVSFKLLNPNIPCLDVDNTVISTENTPWLRVSEGMRRVALINNFGASGSNAAMIIEEYVAASVKSVPSGVSSYVFALSAKDNTALEKMRTNLLRWLQVNEETSPADLSYTLMARRQIYSHRLVFTAGTTEESISRLGHATPVQVDSQDSPVVFVFSGQGSQFRAMGSSLYSSCSYFRKCIDECDYILRASGFASILPVITGVSTSVSESDCTESVFQTAIFSLEYALAMLWMSWDIKPAAVVGHSLGEYAALVVAGVFSLRDAVNLVAERSRLMFEKCVYHSTGMLAVGLEPAKLRSILQSSERFNWIISCYNSPRACVISGPIEELATLKETLESTFTCKCTQLDVPFASHSPAMIPILDDLTAIGHRVKARPPSIPVLSTVFGRIVMPEEDAFCTSDYLVKHCACPVRFVDAIESYIASPSLYTAQTTWIEIGPHPSLSPMLKSFPSLSMSNVIVSLHRKHDDWTALSKALASLYLTHSINWRVFFSQIGHAEVLSLPSYPFSLKKYWITYKETATMAGTEFSIIQNRKQQPCPSNMGIAIFESSVSHLTRYMDGHRVGGVPLCPASVFIELVATGTTLALKQLSPDALDSVLEFNNFTFTKPLIIKSSRKDATNVQICVDTMAGVFSVSSRSGSSACHDEIIHAEGRYKLLGKIETLGEFEDLISTIDRMKDILRQRAEIFSASTIYDRFSRVVCYSQEFRTIRTLTLSSDRLEATANVRIDVGFHYETFSVDILLADTLLHVPGFIANLQGGQIYAYICREIGSLIVLPGHIDKTYEYTIYCKVSELPDGMLCDSYAFRNGQSCVLVAVAQGIWFQRVNLASLKLSLKHSAGLHTSDKISTTVVEIVARTCDLDITDVSFEEDFDSSGVGSLIRVDLCHDIVAAFPDMHVHLEDISRCKTIQAIIELISGRSVAITPQTLSTSSNSADIEKNVQRIFAQVLDIDEDSIKEDLDLGSLGLDSLACLEVVHLLATRCGVHLPVSFINSNRTICDVQSYLSSSASFRDDSSTHAVERVTKNLPCVLDLQKPLWCLQKSDSSRTPLVLIHDGSGLIACYRRILDIHRDLYGINNPYVLESSPGWSSIAELAVTYAGYIEKEISGPMLVGGWSFGGVVAFEVARVLRARSFSVKGVVLIDSPSPLVCAELNTDIIDYVLRNAKSIDPEFWELCKSQFSTNSKLLSEYQPSISKLDGPIIPIVFLRSIDGFNPPHLAVPAWLADRKDTESIVSGWDALSGSPVCTIDIPGNHFQPFDSEIVEAVSLGISQACNILDGQYLNPPTLNDIFNAVSRIRASHG